MYRGCPLIKALFRVIFAGLSANFYFVTLNGCPLPANPPYPGTIFKAQVPPTVNKNGLWPPLLAICNCTCSACDDVTYHVLDPALLRNIKRFDGFSGVRRVSLFCLWWNVGSADLLCRFEPRSQPTQRDGRQKKSSFSPDWQWIMVCHDLGARHFRNIQNFRYAQIQKLK